MAHADTDDTERDEKRNLTKDREKYSTVQRRPYDRIGVRFRRRFVRDPSTIYGHFERFCINHRPSPGDDIPMAVGKSGKTFENNKINFEKLPAAGWRDNSVLNGIVDAS